MAFLISIHQSKQGSASVLYNKSLYNQIIPEGREQSANLSIRSSILTNGPRKECGGGIIFRSVKEAPGKGNSPPGTG